MKEMAARYDEAYLDKWLVTPFKFLTWAEIQAEAGYMNMNNTNNFYNNGLNTNPNPYPVNPDPNAAYPPVTNQPANAGMDTTKTNTQHWWETNTTMPVLTNEDGSAPVKIQIQKLHLLKLKHLTLLHLLQFRKIPQS